MTDETVKKMLWVILVLLAIISTLVFFFAPNSNGATPDKDFDLWEWEVRTYTDGLFKAEIAEQWGAAGWSEAVEVELAQRARYRTTTSTVSYIGVTGECGGATNGADQFIGRESGGQANVSNPSGAWGCYQIMPGTWTSSCSDLGQHGSANANVQAECASRLPLSAWGG